MAKLVAGENSFAETHKLPLEGLYCFDFLVISVAPYLFKDLCIIAN